MLTKLYGRAPFLVLKNNQRYRNIYQETHEIIVYWSQLKSPIVLHIEFLKENPNRPNWCQLKSDIWESVIVWFVASARRILSSFRPSHVFICSPDRLYSASQMLGVFGFLLRFYTLTMFFVFFFFFYLILLEVP